MSGWFIFTDTSLTGSGISVNISTKCYTDDADDETVIFLFPNKLGEDFIEFFWGNNMKVGSINRNIQIFFDITSA